MKNRWAECAFGGQILSYNYSRSEFHPSGWKAWSTFNNSTSCGRFVKLLYTCVMKNAVRCRDFVLFIAGCQFPDTIYDFKSFVILITPSAQEQQQQQQQQQREKHHPPTLSREMSITLRDNMKFLWRKHFISGTVKFLNVRDRTIFLAGFLHCNLIRAYANLPACKLQTKYNTMIASQ